MKNIRLIRIAVMMTMMLSVITACDVDRVDTEPIALTEAAVFDEPGDYYRFTLGIYSKMTDFYAPQRQLYPLHHLPGDDISYDNGSFGYETFQGLTAGTGAFRTYYDALYEMILRTNILLEKTENDPGLWDAGDANQFEYYRGEAFFFRAFAHFRLYVLFGTAPVVTERVNLIENAHIPRSSGVELLDQAIADWEAAAPLLPQNWSAEYVGRATKSSAYGMLMRAYMLRGDYAGSSSDYQAVLTNFNLITDKSLVSNYLDNFSLWTENNNESIFEYQANIAPNVDNIWLSNDGDNGANGWAVVESMGANWRFFSTIQNTGYGGAPWMVTPKVLALMPDPRLDSLVNPGDDIFLKYGRPDLDVTNGGPIADGGFGDANGTNSNSSINNARIMRYSEALLLAAEATLLTGGTVANAIGFVNQVRDRADDWSAGGTGTGANVAPLDPNTLTGGADGTAMDAVQTERLIELCGEEFVRWTDIRRWHARGDADYDLSTWDGSANEFSTRQAGFGFSYPRDLLWPIPSEEVQRNNAINANNTGWD